MVDFCFQSIFSARFHLKEHKLLHEVSIFRWARRGIVVPFVRLRCRLRRRRRTHFFGYDTNMVQQIEFI